MSAGIGINERKCCARMRRTVEWFKKLRAQNERKKSLMLSYVNCLIPTHTHRTISALYEVKDSAEKMNCLCHSDTFKLMAQYEKRIVQGDDLRQFWLNIISERASNGVT